jgi:tripartite-type tricarboxylate transporter receptor subunit TctC
MEAVVKAPPDGYTILIVGSSFWIATLFQKNLPYDPVRDFTPITMTHMQPNVMAVHASLPVKSVKELIALAKARPGELNFSEGGPGSTGQIAGLLFNSMAGTRTVPISYKGTSPTVTAILTGEVQLTFAPPVVVFPHIKSGRLKGLAVTSAEPSALVPGLPAVAATVPGYLSVTAFSVWAPAKTPATVVNRLNQEIGRYLRTAEAKDKFFSAGTETMPGTPEELGNAMKSELTRLGNVLRDAGIKPE